ncbi:hypothetical protein [Limnohabitans radicicola]|uniref:Uncharacterized protein n=1 Tax=Limnohabitans radicicola TaxID=2771427 RepID=A0A927FI90_9BURK|nr:hypothetical protein [Limnohabitans radicicola]MBD8051974.1 hypothetical protein [Limnohabitans radicicola]
MSLLSALMKVLPTKAGSQVFQNRRNPNARFCSVADVSANVSDLVTGITERIPPGSQIIRDANGKYAGYITPPNPRP